MTHAESPRFPGPLLRRTRGLDPSSKATLWVKGHCHPRASSAKTRGFHTQLDEGPDKNTGVGCHFLLQCMKVKSESEVTQSCPTLGDPMDCSLPGFSVHGILQTRTLEWVAISFSNA